MDGQKNGFRHAQLRHVRGGFFCCFCAYGSIGDLAGRFFSPEAAATNIDSIVPDGSGKHL